MGLTRSALLRLGNARSRLAAASAAVLTVPILFFGSAFIDHIPQATLAGVLIVTAWGPAVEPLCERFEREISPATQVVILDVSHAREVRFTALRAPERLARDLAQGGVHMRLAGVTPEMRGSARADR